MPSSSGRLVVVVFTIAHVRSKRYSASAKRDSANADDNERNVTYSCGASNVTIADKSNDARPKLDTPETHLHTAVTIAPAFGSAVEPSKSILERSSISDKMEDKQWSALSCAERECVVPSMKQRCANRCSSQFKLEESYENFNGPFFETTDTYWSPACQTTELYEEFSARKFREIPRSQIKVLSHLGAGQFGTVYKGTWQSSEGFQEVAVKELHSDAVEEDQARFLREAAINGQFNGHPNIVHLYGVVTIGTPTMIVLELLSNGNLRDYLQDSNKSTGKSFSPVLANKLLNFCQQVGSGMEYLSNKSFVHRDLAARNVLVSKDHICKIADFGMARDLDCDYYVARAGGKIPVRWTAPEAFTYNKYSIMSDVWSFGTVMYEIWSCGHRPFDGCTNTEIIRIINSGARLAPPPGCPRSIYELMIKCWNPMRMSRPKFRDILDTLKRPVVELFVWTKEDLKSHQQCSVIGAPIDAGKELLIYLSQLSYIEGLGSADNIHLQQAVAVINTQVSLSNAISVNSVQDSPIPQKVLSGMIQAQQFHILLESSSPANRACLLSVAAPHASSWLSVVRSPGLGLNLESNEYQMAIKWWLGLDTSGRSMCPFCPATALDPLGHYAVTCRHGGDVVIRHNRPRDEVFDLCRRAHLSVSVERGHSLTRDLAHTRPADILIAGWDRGKPAALDLTITSPLCSAILSESCHQASAAALAAEARKLHSNGSKCQELGWSCIPLAVETYGNWGKEAHDTFSRLASYLAIHQSSPKPAVVAEIYGRLNIALVRSIARAILARELPPS
eukprot:Em0020g832a